MSRTRTRKRTTNTAVARLGLFLPVLVSAVALGACRGGSEEKAPASDGVESFPRALALGLALFEKSPEGKQVPQPATAAFLVREGGDWQYRTLVDEDSNVFHKVMEYAPAPGERGIRPSGAAPPSSACGRRARRPGRCGRRISAGSSRGCVTGRLPTSTGRARPTWSSPPTTRGSWRLSGPTARVASPSRSSTARRTPSSTRSRWGISTATGRSRSTATPSLPNKLDGTPQPGEVVRYVPALKEGRKVVADLGDRHAKEILVDDVDGDGLDELYVAIEAVSGGRVEIQRYEADTAADAGVTIATLDDKLCRVLVSGDVEGDGRKEIVAAGFKSGLWLLSPGPGPGDPWTVVSIDRTHRASSTRLSSPISTGTGRTSSTPPATITTRCAATSGRRGRRCARSSTPIPRGCPASPGTSPRYRPSSFPWRSSGDLRRPRRTSSGGRSGRQLEGCRAGSGSPGRC